MKTRVQGTKRRRNAEKNENNNNNDNNNNTKRARKAAAEEAKMWPNGKPWPINYEKPSKELAALYRLLENREVAGLTDRDVDYAKMRVKVLKHQLEIPFLTKQAEENAEEEGAELNRMAGKKGGKRSTRRKRGTRRS